MCPALTGMSRFPLLRVWVRVIPPLPAPHVALAPLLPPSWHFPPPLLRLCADRWMQGNKLSGVIPSEVGLMSSLSSL